MPKSVLDARRRLGDPERASRTVVEAEQGSGVVVDESPGDDVPDLR